MKTRDPRIHVLTSVLRAKGMVFARSSTTCLFPYTSASSRQGAESARGSAAGSGMGGRRPETIRRMGFRARGSQQGSRTQRIEAAKLQGYAKG